MALDTAFLDELRQRTSLTSLFSRRNKLVRSGRNWKACCPFHGEKTPSLYIYDDHYHCFGCGAHGDAITYVMQSEGANFREAVERLAGEAGMDIPADDPQQVEKARVRQTLYDVMEAVQAIYRRRLYQPEGRAGLDYLQKRGLSAETLERFGLGWSGDGRSLLNALAAQSITAETLVQVGLMRVDEAGRPKGELFFNRVMFPIRDRKGRIISFGGRVLGDGQPKYLNGPETDIFSKRRTLFNIDQARQAIHKGAKAVVVEGYMDVIAMAQAGFGGAVAPLGTALGEEQMELLWRMTDGPIICFDGDGAGQRAALRSCEVALPLLKIGRTVRFCRLDGGDDPDSLIQREGAKGMEARLAQARPMEEELFSLLTAQESNPTPERRAALREKLYALARMIPDKLLAGEYRSTFSEMFFARYRRVRGGRGGYGQRSTEYTSVVPIAGERQVEAGSKERLNLLTALLLQYPEILPGVDRDYNALLLPPALAKIRTALLSWMDEWTGPLTAAACQQWMDEHGLTEMVTQLHDSPMPRQVKVAEGEDRLQMAMKLWWHFYALENLKSLQENVEEEVRKTVEFLFSAPADSDEATQRARLAAMKARQDVLFALRQGEKPMLEGDVGE
ncbi:DNA primase [Bombella saccharophila]|uniref:DNA primase n=1 Tax=Bombella saccharophila TaxID=2967338 RepID=A0ABT3W7P8_9PROT|nr:DNA primase [Bombella saccharophila]MCX5615102.1 DNA primase [Bombella saccharophila]